MPIALGVEKRERIFGAKFIINQNLSKHTTRPVRDIKLH